MRITILTYGSRGDVQPFAALARYLQKRGHSVKLAAPYRFADFARGIDLPFVPLAGDPEVISRRINAAGTNAAAVIASIWKYIFRIAPQVSRSAFQACESADLIVHSFLFTAGAHSWAREKGVLDVSVQTFPMFAPTREFPNVALPRLPAGPLSLLSHLVATQVFWYGGRIGYGPARRGNPDVFFPAKLYWPFDKSRPLHLRTPLLCAYSPQVLPRPQDWEANILVTGYFFLEQADYRPPSALMEFLDSGPAPICVTFGSMIQRKAGQVIQIVMDAIRRSGDRAVLLTGWNDFRLNPGQQGIFFMESAPHHWLFQHCKSVIHHGGAGTTGAGLRAGVPNIILPHTADQPFWGLQVHRIGAGPEPIHLKDLSVSSLCRALEEAGSRIVRERAGEIGRIIENENGVERAAEIIEAHAAGMGRSVDQADPGIGTF